MTGPGPYRENAREPEARRKRWPTPVVAVVIAAALIPFDLGILWRNAPLTVSRVVVFAMLIQWACAGVASVKGLLSPRGTWSFRCGVIGTIVALVPVGLFMLSTLYFVAVFVTGGAAWGRPLRLRGRVLHPELRAGSDWTRGDRPDVTALDAPTRAALEALWLHDAQKEHASVPALTRVSWLLAAVGAPADLVEAVHLAVLEEIEHARLCFALAAGYGGRSHTVEPMPELLVGGLDLGGDPLVRIAVESLNDGCLLEDFNADVARVCAQACRDAVVRGVLEKITREERSHADLSWRLLAFGLERGGVRVERAVTKALAKLEKTPRPTAVSKGNGELGARADAEAMRAHGRLADAEWGALWDARIGDTRRRVEAMLGAKEIEIVDRVA